jgi:hypothetical protein
MSVDPFGSNSADTAAQDFLAGGTTITSAKWPTVGAIVEGTVVDWQFPVQKTDMDTGELQWFYGKKLVLDSQVPEHAKANGGARPAMQMLLDLQCEPTGQSWETNQYIPVAVPDDDGLRRAYVSGELQSAIGAALKEAAASLEKGAYLQVVRTQPVKKGSGFYAYTYKAKWTKASDNAKAATAFVTQVDDDPFAVA